MFFLFKRTDGYVQIVLDKYNEEVQAFGLQQMGQRRRGQYEEGVPRVQIPSPSP